MGCSRYGGGLGDGRGDVEGGRVLEGTPRVYIAVCFAISSHRIDVASGPSYSTPSTHHAQQNFPPRDSGPQRDGSGVQSVFHPVRLLRHLGLQKL